MSLGLDYGPSPTARFGVDALQGWRRLDREDDARREWLNAKCGIRPDRLKPERVKDWAPPSHRKVGPR